MATAPASSLLVEAEASLLQAPVDEIVALAELRPGARAVVASVEQGTPEGRRLADLGFVRGTEVRVVKRAPLRDPVAYDIRGTRLCLRRTEAARIRVKPV